MSDLIEDLTDIDPEAIARTVAIETAAAIRSGVKPGSLLARMMRDVGISDMVIEISGKAASAFSTNPDFRARVLATDGESRIWRYMKYWAAAHVEDHYGLEARAMLPASYSLCNPSLEPVDAPLALPAPGA